jgi:hypothetical protein
MQTNFPPEDASLVNTHVQEQLRYRLSRAPPSIEEIEEPGNAGYQLTFTHEVFGPDGSMSLTNSWEATKTFALELLSSLLAAHAGSSEASQATASIATMSHTDRAAAWDRLRERMAWTASLLDSRKMLDTRTNDLDAEDLSEAGLSDWGKVRLVSRNYHSYMHAINLPQERQEIEPRFTIQQPDLVACRSYRNTSEEDRPIFSIHMNPVIHDAQASDGTQAEGSLLMTHREIEESIDRAIGFWKYDEGKPMFDRVASGSADARDFAIKVNTSQFVYLTVEMDWDELKTRERISNARLEQHEWQAPTRRVELENEGQCMDIEIFCVPLSRIE